ncbi:carbohydrate ABC transporter permease [Salinibacterium sp. ZJ70]|jgi:raffinose/stachyose/melibiose transport system permease protein|uniref:carbohydrate ABC transporter permease n=1 Tax=Salinibacterium sp. ZJ70 TaxID=2708084 RepID=UPI001422AC2E|nr:sugar ABC transporter permease [Salinibacterium sp. ZJ70]
MPKAGIGTAPGRASARPGRAGRPTARRTIGSAHAFLYLAPAALIYVGFAIWPALHTAGLSLFEWDGILPPVWVGLENYAEVFTKPLLLKSLGNSFVLILFFSVIPIILGLIMAGLLMGYARRGLTFFRVVYFLPQVLPMVVVGITWRWMYSEDGTLNQGLRLIGLDSITRVWLGDFSFALIALGFVGTWCLAGLCMMLFLAGAQHIDTSLYEAAKLDGAGPFRRFLSVTLPGIRGEVTIASVICTIAALTSFDLVYMTTDGGPANQTVIPGLLVYRLAFKDGEIGTAAALAVTLTVLVILVIGAIRRVAKERE